MALYTKADQLEKLSTGEFCFYKVAKMSYIPFLTVFPSFQGIHTEPTYGRFTSTLDPFLWGSCNTIGHFVPSIVPHRLLQRRAPLGTSAQRLHSPYVYSIIRACKHPSNRWVRPSLAEEKLPQEWQLTQGQTSLYYHKSSISSSWKGDFPWFRHQLLIFPPLWEPETSLALACSH